jgi:CubicO group peptidase (beta-lactamase class C family)
MAEAFLHEAPAVGLTVGVVRGNDMVTLKGYGLADREAKRPATAATVYRVGSITKQFTAAAVLQLVEQGRVRLADTLGAYLPQYPRWGGVTVRQLLNHTSGIPNYTASARWAARMRDALPPDSVLAFVVDAPMQFAPGARFAYSNTNYFLLGRVLERVAGQPYADVMRERFFAPLGMRTAGYCPDEPAGPDDARGYDGPGAPRPAAPISMTSPYSAGALCMSVPDFLRWQEALTSGRVLSPATYARMSTGDSLASGARIAYGWGLVAGTVAGHRVVDHGGDINGFSADQLWLPDDSLRVVVFTNTLGSNPAHLAQNIARAALGQPFRGAPAALVPVALPDALRAAAPGTYALQLPSGATLPLRLWDEGGQLMAQASGPGQGAFPLIHLGDQTFGATFDPTLRLRIVVENGRGVRALLNQRGVATEGARAP